MQRDDAPHILASIAAASARVRKAEDRKRDADRDARTAKDTRDQERRILADRVVVAARNDVPQKLIVESADRTREWVRLAVLGATNPDEVTARMYGSSDGSFRDWRVAAELAWVDAARGKGLEPKVLDDFEATGNQVAQVLVYDARWTLLLDEETVRVAMGNEHYPDPAFDSNYTPEQRGHRPCRSECSCTRC